MEAPSKVVAEYKRIKSRFPFFISLKRINGKYYIYKQLTRTDKTSKKVKILTTYLGRITDEGKFIEKGSKGDYELENAIKLIEARGGKVALQSSVQKILHPEGPLFDETDKKILTALSMNSRIRLSRMSGIVGLSKRKLETKIKKLENTFGIRYTAEIDINKLGYRSYIVFAKFHDQKPSKEAIEEALADEPKVQLGLLTRGIYDLVVYLLAESDNDLSDTMANIRSSEGISAYRSDWYATPLYETYGFIPLREEFFETLKGKVWRRTKESLRPMEGQLYNRDYLVLKEINHNSAIKFSEIDEKYKFEKGAAKYSYHARLEEAGIIKRPTITLENSGVKYNAIIVMGIEVRKEFTSSRKNLWYYEIEETNNVTNKLSFLADIKVPNGVLFIMPIYNDGALELEEEKLKQKVNGIGVNSLVVTDIIVGAFCYRRFDNRHSALYEYLIKHYKENLPQNRENYN